MVTTDEKPPSETVTADVAPAPSEPNTETSATKEGKPKENGPPEAVDKVKEEPTSKRVQEGRAYNNRDRKYNNDRYTKDRNNKDHKKQDYQKNIKSDFSSQKETDDPVQIRKQVEFYFSDSNLLTDAFLFKLVDGPTNNSVPLTTIHSFKRMRRFQPFSAVISALKDSATLNLIEVEEDPVKSKSSSKDDTKDENTRDTKISLTNPSSSTYTPSDHKYHVQRKTPLDASTANKSLPEVARVHEDASMARSIYAKGFGPEQSTTQYDIEAFFAEYGTTRSVRLRRTFDKTFKGSVFVEFDTEETAKQFLDKAKAGQVKWHGSEGGKDLKIMSKKSYCDDKVEEIRKGNIRKHSPQRSRANRGDDDNRDWRTRRDEDRKNGFRGGARGGGRGGRSGGDRRRGGGGGGGRVDSERRNGQRTSPPMVRSTLKDEDEVEGQQGKDDAKDSGEPAATAGTVEAATEKSVDAATLSSAAAPAPAPAPESKKRAREDDEDDRGAVEGEQASKKIDVKEVPAA